MTANHCPTCDSPIPAGAPGGFCPACVLRDAEETIAATPPGGPPLDEVRAAFPQLEVESLIGHGGMGFVFKARQPKARQPSLDRMVALKILAPGLGCDPAFAERFAREARALGKLSHANIVTVFEHGQSGGFYYLLMEYVDGVNLRQAMRAGRFTPAQALSIVPGLCDALQAAHAQGVWHRDIKPENILLDAQGRVKIADFGIARLAGDAQRAFTLTITGARLGSAAYMAPEQHESPHDVDHRADIYSLGVVIYEMLTGELPLGRFPNPSARSAVDARIDEIVLRTLEKERALRQQSAEEVKTEVADAATAAPRSTATTPRASLLISFNIGIAAGVVLLVSAGFLTHGSTQGVLMSFAFVLMAVGLIGAFVYRGKNPQIRITRGVVGALVAFILIAAWWVYYETQQLRAAETEATRRAQDAARAAMEARLAMQAELTAIQARRSGEFPPGGEAAPANNSSGGQPARALEAENAVSSGAESQTRILQTTERIRDGVRSVERKFITDRGEVFSDVPPPVSAPPPQTPGLTGMPEIEQHKAHGRTAFTVHCGPAAVFTLVGGMGTSTGNELFSSGSSVLRESHVHIDHLRIYFAVSRPDSASISGRNYDLTKGRIFEVSDAGVRQFAIECPLKLTDETLQRLISEMEQTR